MTSIIITVYITTVMLTTNIIAISSNLGIEIQSIKKNGHWIIGEHD
jgi:hypothetical protein